MRESPPHLPTIALVVSLMVSSGLLGLHLADRVADHAPDPTPQIVLVRR